MQALMDDPSPDWSVVGVIADRADAGALQRAARAGVASRVIEWGDSADRVAFTEALCDAAAAFRPDYIVLAGFMRILAPVAMDRYPNRIINIHPSLLPAFAGAHAVRDALTHGVKVTGVTIHFVSEELDGGPIICQEAVEVLPGDDEAELHGRLQRVEHRLLPQVVQDLATGILEVSGRTVYRRVNA